MFRQLASIVRRLLISFRTVIFDATIVMVIVVAIDNINVVVAIAITV